MAHFLQVLLEKASREETLVSFLAVGHSEECHFTPDHHFITRAEPRRASCAWLEGLLS